MGMRRLARERALQYLFQHDLNPAEKLEDSLNCFWESQSAPVGDAENANAGPSAQEAAVRGFSDALIRGVLEHESDIDAEIARHAVNWTVKRMATVDRNVLRLAVYELRYRKDIPPIVTINEAVDIAKKYSTQDSGRFVNGILDKIKAEVHRPTRESQL